MKSVPDEEAEAAPVYDSQTACVLIFAGMPETETSYYIDSCAPNCRCEPFPVSQHSAVPVGDNETLIRLIVDPIHVRQEGEHIGVRDSFLEDSIHGGSSCLRLGRATRDEFQRTVDLLIKDKFKPSGEPREVIGYVRIPAAIARAMRFAKSSPPVPKPPDPIPEFRGFAVYATGEGDRPNHSDIMLCNHLQFSRSAKTRHAVNLGKQLKFEKVASVEDVLNLGVA